MLNVFHKKCLLRLRTCGQEKFKITKITVYFLKIQVYQTGPCEYFKISFCGDLADKIRNMYLLQPLNLEPGTY